MGHDAEHKIVKSFAQQRAEGAGPAGPTSGIVCPKCGCETMVTNTMRLLGQVRRYRQCVHPLCRHRFSTKERSM